jgi:CheY-like chemotaxis protein
MWTARHPLGNVLIAEDDPDLRDLLSCFLQRRGYRVFCVRDGVSLLERLDVSTPGSKLPGIDIVVSDVYMPGLDGLRALEDLRQDGSRIPVILMTGFASREIYERGRRQGVAAVLAKPFELSELLSAVDHARFGHPN